MEAVLITGRTKGIGRSIVERLLKAGATIITTARTIPDDLPDSVGFIQANVTTPEGTEKIIKGTLEKFGGLDILINNVGGSSSSTAGALTLEEIAELVAFIVSDRASYITGSEYIIDGGIIRTI